MTNEKKDSGAGLIHQPIPDVVDTEPRLNNKRSMEFFASKFNGVGHGNAGDCRVVVRTPKKSPHWPLVQIIDDSDGVGLGFTVREVPDLVAALIRAYQSLQPIQSGKVTNAKMAILGAVNDACNEATKNNGDYRINKISRRIDDLIKLVQVGCVPVSVSEASASLPSAAQKNTTKPDSPGREEGAETS